MNYQTLGNSGLLISELSFGGMSLPDGDANNILLLHRALEGGINLFDTADVYQQGRNEELFGWAFRELRQEVQLATKVGNQPRPDGSGWDWNPRKRYILAAAEQSLRRLQTDYIDLYQLHGGTLDDPLDETIEAFELLKEQGKIRAYGISSIRPNVIREWVRRSNLSSVMTQYGLLDRRPEEETLDLLREKGIGVLVRGSLAKGLLVDKPATPFLGYDAAAVQKAADAVGAASGRGRSRAATAIRFALNHPAVTSAVVGIRTPEQLETALAVSNSPELTARQFEQMGTTLPANRYVNHR
ncbi:MAG: aldo/keto reductase [Sphingobacteriaceae bacterium]|nr:aldo/keto reductase [Cytophagaceae bacterium]